MSTSPLPASANQSIPLFGEDREGARGPLERRPMSLEQYLHSSFHPDQDYADGHAEERNVGEYEHGKIGFWLARLLDQHSREWKIDVVPECRLQVSPDRFRVPDILVLHAGTPARPYPTTAPLICIEVLSPEDQFSRLRARLEDYRRMGVENIWVIDPESRAAFRYDAEGYRKVATLAVEGTPIAIPVSEVFSPLDEQ